MKIISKVILNSLIFAVFFLFSMFLSTYVVKSLSKIVNKVEIVDVIGIKLIKDEKENSQYKLIEIPNNINIIDAKIITKKEVYKFSTPDRILLNSDEQPVSELTDAHYTLVLNTKELGQIYKIINKTDYGYKVLDIKVGYNKYKNTLEFLNSNVTLANCDITIFKNDVKVGTTKLDDEGKGSIYINDIENLTTSTYTILAKKGSEILGIDAFHMTPIYRELDLKNNVSFNIISQISNKLNISIKNESGITIDDKVQILSVYDESNPNENLLLNLNPSDNNISDLKGEIILKNTLNKDKNYKVRLKVNGVELDSQDDCEVHIKNLDISKIKVSVVEKVGKELNVDLSGINNLSKDDLIEIVSLHDVKNKDKNLIYPGKLTNKVNEIPVLDRIYSNNSYELVLKINDFEIGGFGVEVIPIDLSNALAMTDIISNKIFISFENTKGLKITDIIKVVGVFKDGDVSNNLLKSSYNTIIDKFNGTVFINQPLDTKNNYYVKFKVNEVELDNMLKVIVNNNISLIGADVRTETSSHEIKINFKNIDSINNNDIVEVESVFSYDDPNFNLLDKTKETKILNKTGIIYLKGGIVPNKEYGIKIKINGVIFKDAIKVSIDNHKNNKIGDAYSYEDKLILNLNIEKPDKIDVVSLRNLEDNTEILSNKMENLLLNERNELIIPLDIPLKDNVNYSITLDILNKGVLETNILEFNNKIKYNDNVKVEEDDHVKMNSIEFGDGCLKFLHEISEKININEIFASIPELHVRIEEQYIIVEKLIPYKRYSNLIITVKGDNDFSKEFKLPKFQSKKSSDEIKNFISKTYINLKNNMSNLENEIEFASEERFWYWNDKIRNKEIDLKSFIFKVIEEEKIIERYKDNVDRIRILYSIIFGISPTEQSLGIWVNDLNNVLRNQEINDALHTVIEKMFTNFRFKSLERLLK